jgi:hypothetical protein
MLDEKLAEHKGEEIDQAKRKRFMQKTWNVADLKRTKCKQQRWQATKQSTSKRIFWRDCGLWFFFKRKHNNLHNNPHKKLFQECESHLRLEYLFLIGLGMSKVLIDRPLVDYIVDEVDADDPEHAYAQVKELFVVQARQHFECLGLGLL